MSGELIDGGDVFLDCEGQAEGSEGKVAPPVKPRDPKETLERRSSKSRLSKQDEVEEEDHYHVDLAHADLAHTDLVHHDAVDPLREPTDTHREHTESKREHTELHKEHSDSHQEHIDSNREHADSHREHAGSHREHADPLRDSSEPDHRDRRDSQDPDQDHSPSSEASDATIVPTGVDTPVVRTPGGSPESENDTKLEPQKSVDSDKSSPTQGNPKAKLLVRSKAVCDDTSPPPEDTSQSMSGGLTTSTSSSALSATNSASVSPVPMATLTVSPTPHRRKLEKDGSQGSMSDNSNSPMLSRDSSMEYYTDSTGTDLESFIKMTLNKNRNDRMTLLELETKKKKVPTATLR